MVHFLCVRGKPPPTRLLDKPIRRYPTHRINPLFGTKCWNASPQTRQHINVQGTDQILFKTNAHGQLLFSCKPAIGTNRHRMFHIRSKILALTIETNSTMSTKKIDIQYVTNRFSMASLGITEKGVSLWHLSATVKRVRIMYWSGFT